MTPEVRVLFVLCVVAWTCLLSFLIAPFIFDRLSRHADCALADYPDLDDRLHSPVARRDSPESGGRRVLNHRK